jgi:hypothetical protein
MTRNDNKMLKKIERFLTLFFINLITIKLYLISIGYYSDLVDKGIYIIILHKKYE